MPTRLDELQKGHDRSEYAKILGMTVLEVGAGYALVQMRADPSFGGANMAVHNGIIMSLADQAFGIATNSLDSDRNYVAIQFGISFLSPVLPDEEVVAEGRVCHLAEGRGTCEIVLRAADGRVIAQASGTVLAVPKASGTGS